MISGLAPRSHKINCIIWAGNILISRSEPDGCPSIRCPPVARAQLETFQLAPGPRAGPTARLMRAPTWLPVFCVHTKSIGAGPFKLGPPPTSDEFLMSKQSRPAGPTGRGGGGQLLAQLARPWLAGSLACPPARPPYSPHLSAPSARSQTPSACVNPYLLRVRLRARPPYLELQIIRRSQSTRPGRRRRRRRPPSASLIATRFQVSAGEKSAEQTKDRRAEIEVRFDGCWQ